MVFIKNSLRQPHGWLGDPAMSDCGVMPMTPRVIIVHGIAHARAAAAAATKLDVVVRIRSAPGAAAYAGAGWFMEMISIVRAEFPNARIEASLDCADAPGYAMAALRRGTDMIRFRGTRTACEKVTQLARRSRRRSGCEPCGATRPVGHQ